MKKVLFLLLNKYLFTIIVSFIFIISCNKKEEPIIYELFSTNRHVNYRGTFYAYIFHHFTSCYCVFLFGRAAKGLQGNSWTILF